MPDDAGPAIAVVQTRRVPLDDLIAHPDNARRGNVDVIADSLRSHGQYRALVVNTRTGHVVAGNHTLAALRATGATHALCHEIDVSPDQERRIMLMDNRSPDLATYDDGALAELLSALGDLDGTGFTSTELDALLRSMEDDEIDGSPTLGAVDYRILVECDGEHHQAELLGRFATEGLRTHAIAQ